MLRITSLWNVVILLGISMGNDVWFALWDVDAPTYRLLMEEIISWCTDLSFSCCVRDEMPAGFIFLASILHRWRGRKYYFLNHQLHPSLFQNKLPLFTPMLLAPRELYISEVESLRSRFLIFNSISSTNCFHELTSSFLRSYNWGAREYLSDIGNMRRVVFDRHILLNLASHVSTQIHLP